MSKYNCGIYKITNINNGKYYIGSSININRRWHEHKRNLNKNKHNNIHLQKSWNKYGEASFLFEIIELVENEKDLIICEQQHLNSITPFNSMVTFNICKMAYSTLGIKHSNETKNKMSVSHNGTTHKKETIFKMIQIKTKQSENTKSKLSKINKGKIAQNKQPIYQMDLNNNIVKMWNSVTDAAKILNISTSLICGVCQGRRKSTGGFKW